jgi:CO dehydrogenase/acetyl-CoA synthase epsilon subunit
MARFDGQRWARYLTKHKYPLVVAGDGCDRIVLDGTRLAEYAALVATKLGCPVAATGNTILGLRQTKGIKIKKMWLAELFRYLQDEWAEPLLARRPDLLILIGYHPDLVSGMVAGLKAVHTVHLGPGRVAAADRTMEEGTLAEWKQNLDELVSCL